MKKAWKAVLIILGAIAAGSVIVGILDRKEQKKRSSVHKPYGIYEAYFKRPMDFICGILAILVFWPVYLIVAVLVRIKLGTPVLFTQSRPGRIDPETGKEKIFKMYKFRTMTDERDEKGNLLPDQERITKFGKILRVTSLDELPEVVNIIKGDMSMIGPRPQLVKDMVFMTGQQRQRHTVRPGLSGLAQVNGRNSISWEEKFKWDLKYIRNITFLGDTGIVADTVRKALIRHEGITQEDMATAMDYGDVLLKTGRVSKQEYDKKQREAKKYFFQSIK